MTWLQFRLETTDHDSAQWEALLLAQGAVAVTLQDAADQPVLEPGPGETPLWRSITLTGLFPADADMNPVRDAAQALHSQQAQTSQDPQKKPTHDAKIRIEILEDRDWEREWMQHYKPMQFGSQLWVCPSWIEPPEPDAINLLLDPGLAFGTGTHPTTALCLAALADLQLAGEILEAAVVDYGCGSGILAVAALKLGAKEALCVDNDPQALIATRDNANRNSLPTDQLTLALPQHVEPAWNGAAHLVIANILAGPLYELSATLLQFMRPKATLILSGLLATQAEQLIAHYESDIQLSLYGEQDGWVCLQGTR